MWAPETRCCRSDDSPQDQRAQSETLGFVLLFSMVLLGASTVVFFGAAAVSESDESLSADRAEKVMTQMDSEISMVSLGRTDSQRMAFDQADGEEFRVDEDAGTINITTVDFEDREVTGVIMPDTTLGAVKFERGDKVIAYQGGGVWRADGGEGSGMISPPEFNYRDRTLTLPLVTVTGDNSLNREAVIRKGGPSETYFPDPDGELTNPLEDEIVRVTVETEFHEGWRTYFETRTEGEVMHEPEQQRVSVDLTAAAVESFDHGAATTGSDGLETGSNGEIVGPTRTDLDAASASPDVEQRIEDCEDGEIDCTEVDEDWFESNDTSAGTYFADDTLDLSGNTEVEFDTSDGDIELVVDGELKIGGNVDISVTGDGQARFYVNRSVDIGGTPDTGDEPERLVILAHTEAEEIEFGGDQDFSGYIYAPSSEFSASGNAGQITGGMVVEGGNLQNHNLVHENPGFELEVGDGVNALTFLHISTNPVTVTGN